jgi:hypothetical protein
MMWGDRASKDEECEGTVKIKSIVSVEDCASFFVSARLLGTTQLPKNEKRSGHETHKSRQVYKRPVSLLSNHPKYSPSRIINSLHFPVMQDATLSRALHRR